jgi:hypothetical protein
MITPIEKEAIIIHLGKQPSRIIRPYLKKKKLFNTSGKEFSPKSIQNFLNGITENLLVEKAISEINALKNKVK